NCRIKVNRPWWQPGFQRIYKQFHALVQRDKESVARPAWLAVWRMPHFSALSPHGQNQAAVLLLHFQESWHRRAQAEFFWIRSINSSDHRLGHAFQSLLSQTPAHKAGQALILVWRVVTLARQDQICSQAQFPKPTKDG